MPPGARGTAQRVVDHFEARVRCKPGLALRNPRVTYRICAFLLAAAVVMGAAGYALARARSDSDDPLVPLLLLIGGLGLGVFALILALAAFTLTRRG